MSGDVTAAGLRVAALAAELNVRRRAMPPHELAYRNRKPIFIGTTLIAAVIGIVAPSQPLEVRLVAPMLALVAFMGGFMVGWFPLRFQALLWSRVAPDALRMICLVTFYLFFLGTLFSILLYPLFAGELKSEGFTLGAFALLLPAGAGASAGALRAYSAVASPNTSLERTRKRKSAKYKRRRARRSTQPLGG